MQEQVADVAGFEFGRVHAPTTFAGTRRILSGGSCPPRTGLPTGVPTRAPAPTGNRRGRWSLCGACDAAPRRRGVVRRPAFDAAKVASVCGVEYHSEATEATEAWARRTPRPRGPGSRRGSPRRGPSAASSRPSSPRGLSNARCRRRRKLRHRRRRAGGGVHRGTNQEGHLRHRRCRPPAAFVPAGAWAETAEVAADLNAVGASRGGGAPGLGEAGTSFSPVRICRGRDSR